MATEVWSRFPGRAATWDVWQGLNELSPYFEQYDQLSEDDQTAIAAQAGLIGLSTSMSCNKGDVFDEDAMNLVLDRTQ